jgi:hypothetical protein
LEGTRDGTRWLELDRRENNGDLKEGFSVCTFAVARSGQFQQIRLRQLGPNHSGTNALVVSSFEVFGSLICRTRKREFPPKVNQGAVASIWGDYKYDVPDGIVAHLARECGGNVHDRGIVEVTSSKPYSKGPGYAGKNITDMEADSFFCSDFRESEGKDKVEIPHAKNNWVCYDFKERRVVPTH